MTRLYAAIYIPSSLSPAPHLILPLNNHVDEAATRRKVRLRTVCDIEIQIDFCIVRTQALQKVQASSDVEMEGNDEEFDDAKSEEEEVSYESDGSMYDSKTKGGKRKGNTSGSSGRSPKRARKNSSKHDPEEIEVKGEAEEAEASSSSTTHSASYARCPPLLLIMVSQNRQLDCSG